MQKIQLIDAIYSTQDKAFHCLIEDEQGERTVSISKADFLAFKEAKHGFIRIDVTRQVMCMDSETGGTYWEEEEGTQTVNLAEYIETVGQFDLEAELAVLIDRMEGRDVNKDLPVLGDIFQSVKNIK